MQALSRRPRGPVSRRRAGARATHPLRGDARRGRGGAAKARGDGHAGGALLRRQRFATQAAALSNCPSGAEGGELGWLELGDCAPEFGRELFGRAEVGVLPRLVHSRFGLHVVEVIAREPGIQRPFEAVRAAVELALRQQAFVASTRQFLQLLAADARIEGVDLEAADSPLVQ